ncbi:MAG: hypothetical protein NVS1B6_05470 [Steroidobacteraceae bacterium]
MNALTAVRVAAIVCAGLLAGLYLGYRAGVYQALQGLTPSSFVQFHQILHGYYSRFLPFLVLAAVTTTLGWLVMIRSQERTAEFRLIVASACGIVVIAVLTRIVNVPLNTLLMTWNVAHPPINLKALWEPWDRVNTIRTMLAAGVFILEVVAVSLKTTIDRSC